MLNKIGVWYFQHGWLFALIIAIIWGIICNNGAFEDKNKDLIFFTGLIVLTIIGIIMVIFKYYK